MCTVLVSLVQCFAWSLRFMYLLARVRTYTGTSCAVGQHRHCTFLPLSVMYLRVRACILVQCFVMGSWTARQCTFLPVSVMYLRVRACILVQCFVMGNPSHVRVLVFGLSRCNCSATPTDMDSLLVMSRDSCYVRCICAGCLYLTRRDAILCLPVRTANRKGWQPRLIYTMYIIHHDFHVLCSTSSVAGVR